LIGPLWWNNLFGSKIRKWFEYRWKKIKHVPDQEKIWRVVRSKDQVYDDGKVKPVFFRENRPNTFLSCDLARFTTIQKTLTGIGDNPHPAASGIVEFSAAAVRAPQVASNINHDPDENKGKKNYAHCMFTTKLSPEQEIAMTKDPGLSVIVKQQFRNKKTGG
jgi:hypothetical protein